jgi:hypothetical protein
LADLEFEMTDFSSRFELAMMQRGGKAGHIMRQTGVEDVRLAGFMRWFRNEG